MGIFDKLKQGLAKTGRLLKTDVRDLFKAEGRLIDGPFLDEMRAILFKTDMGFDAVEQIVSLAEKAGLPMTHLAMAFAITHHGVTSALIGPRTMEQLDDLLAGIDVTLTDDILDRIDEIVPPGTDVGAPDQSAYLPPAVQRPDLRRRPAAERAAADRD